ncbi:MAG: hypothetical protein DRQ58_12085 [Gammaproteobacteria bacterium]|nr:MAG: hypothetical protein DRQ58_12085 [Gammaproteobacteria bacterium]
MSFLEQERALFDLLFDQSLRENFCKGSTTAFSEYELDDGEIEDFKEIRPDAIELDASMRTYLILTHICRQFPVSFSLVSSLQNGISLLQGLINLQTMRCHPTERATVFTSQLREELSAPEYSCEFDSDKELGMITAILEAELGMAWTSAILKQKVLEGKLPSKNMPDDFKSNDEDWLNKPIKLASYVSAVIIPQSYVKLKQTLCPCEDTGLWAHLSKTQLSASLRSKTLAYEDPRLFITRAHISTLSRCEPTVDHQTAELTEGFAPLFQHVNGTNTTGQILAQLKQAGAADEILQGVEAGFHQLLTSGILKLA